MNLQLPRRILSMSLVLALSTVAGCGKSPRDRLDGAWEIDMPATLDQARSIGAGAADLEGVRRTFDGARMTIAPKSVTIWLAGESGGQSFKAQVEATQGDCATLRVEQMGVGTYCVSGKHLKVSQPGTRLIVVYRRA